MLLIVKVALPYELLRYPCLTSSTAASLCLYRSTVYTLLPLVHK